MNLFGSVGVDAVESSVMNFEAGDFGGTVSNILHHMIIC